MEGYPKRLASQVGLELHNSEGYHQPLVEFIPCRIAFLLARFINGSSTEARCFAGLMGYDFRI